MSSADNSFFPSITQSLNQSSVLASQTARESQSQSQINSQLPHQHHSNNQGTTSISLADELVKEYLLYRGFTTTLRLFDQDLKQDRDRSFRVDKITEQLLVYIHSFDLNGFMEYWTYLDQKFFTKMTFKMGASTSLTRRYEINLMRYYLVNAVKSGKIDKAFEFIENYLVKLQSQSEWKEWYCLPFLKSPEDHPFFSIYFSQPWIDALMVSLQNFLNILFQLLPFPRLLNYDESLFWFKQNNVCICYLLIVHILK